jgi:uncharacterized membrane protein
MTVKQGNVTEFQKTVADAVDHVIPAVEAIGAAVVVIGALISALIFVLSETRLSALSADLTTYLGIGLEFFLAAGLIRLASVDTFQMLGLTAAIIAVRRTIVLGLGYAARASG